MFTLYSMQRSGNSYKTRLALAQLGVRYRLVEIDILKGESHTPEFLAKNPNGQVPLLEVAPGRYLAESNAILWYIAGGTPLAPEDRIDRAEILQWMFFEQHSLEPNIGAAYFWLALVKGGRDLQQHALEDWMEEGNRALGVMEQTSRAARFLRRRALHHRRHRALRLHPRRASMRLRSHDVSGDPRLARSRRQRARLCADGISAGRRVSAGIAGRDSVAAKPQRRLFARGRLGVNDSLTKTTNLPLFLKSFAKVPSSQRRLPARFFASTQN